MMSFDHKYNESEFEDAAYVFVNSESDIDTFRQNLSETFTSASVCDGWFGLYRWNGIRFVQWLDNDSISTMSNMLEMITNIYFRKPVGKCPRCKSNVFKSRVVRVDCDPSDQYYAECLECDEDFYECEVIKVEN